MTTPALDKPLTGEEYLESLRDGREVWIDGEKVADVTEHPAFRNAARSVARLYDALHDPAHSDMLTTGPPRHPHAQVLQPPYSVAGPARRARGDRALVAHVATASWAARRTTRPSFMADASAPIPTGTRRSPAAAAHWYRAYAARGAVPQPRPDQPADRPRQGRARGRGRLRPRREGARRRHRRQRREDARDGLGAHARDVRRAEQRRRSSRRARPRTTRSSSSPRWTRRARSSLCRRSYEATARLAVRPPALQPLRRERRGHRLRQRVHPVGERPRLPRRRARRPASTRSPGSCNRYTLQSGTRLAVKLDFMTGLSRARAGDERHRRLPRRAGRARRAVGWRNLMWAMTTALCHDTQPGPGESIVPQRRVRRRSCGCSAASRRRASTSVFAADPRRQRRSSSRRASRTCRTRSCAR